MAWMPRKRCPPRGSTTRPARCRRSRASTSAGSTRWRRAAINSFTGRSETSSSAGCMPSPAIRPRVSSAAAAIRAAAAPWPTHRHEYHPNTRARERALMAKALLIIDFQNDFTGGGTLAVPEGDEIAGAVKRLAEHFDFIAATRDWHPPDHASFETEGGPWPVHCVQGTHGAAFHPAMEDIQPDAVVDVGQGRDDEGYSGFENSDLARILRDHDTDQVYVCGL